MRKQKALLIAFSLILAVSVAYAAVVGTLVFQGSGTLGQLGDLQIRQAVNQNVVTAIPASDITTGTVGDGASVGSVEVSGDRQVMTFNFLHFPAATDFVTANYSVVNTGAAAITVAVVPGGPAPAAIGTEEITITLSNGNVLGAGSTNSEWRDVSDLFTIVNSVAGATIPAGEGANFAITLTYIGTDANLTAANFPGIPADATLDGATISFTLSLEYATP